MTSSCSVVQRRNRKGRVAARFVLTQSLVEILTLHRGSVRAFPYMARFLSFLFGVPLAMLAFLLLAGSGDFLGLVLAMLFGSLAFLCIWFGVHGHDRHSRSMLASCAAGGVLVGGVSFLVGFIGPMIFAPQANQGPLLGIFITGPIGFVVGVILGLVSYSIRHRDG